LSLKGNTPLSYERKIPYESQFGLSGDMISICNSMLTQVLGISSSGVVLTVYVLNYSIGIIWIAFLLIWVKREFGKWEAALVFLGFIGSRWIIAMLGSIYWMIWSWYLPMLILLAFYQNEKFRKHPIIFFSLTSLAFLFKFMCGYEYASSMGIACVTPMLYYGLKESWAIGKWIKNLLIPMSAFVLGFGGAIGAHLWRLKIAHGSMSASLDVLISTVARRSGDVQSLAQWTNASDQVMIESLKASPISVIFTYFLKENVWAGLPVFIIVGLLVLTTIILLKQKIFALTNEKLHTIKYLSIVCIFGSFGPISWFVLMKGHSYIHTHINYVLWYLPFLFWLFILWGTVIRTLVEYIESRKTIREKA